MASTGRVRDIRCPVCKYIPAGRWLVILPCDSHKKCRLCGHHMENLVITLSIVDSRAIVSIAHRWADFTCSQNVDFNARSTEEEFMAAKQPLRELLEAPIMFGFLASGAGVFMLTFADKSLTGSHRFAYAVIDARSFIRYVDGSSAATVEYDAEKVENLSIRDAQSSAVAFDQFSSAFGIAHMSRVPTEHGPFHAPVGRISLPEQAAIHDACYSDLNEPFPGRDAKHEHQKNQLMKRWSFETLSATSGYGRKLVTKDCDFHLPLGRCSR